MIKPAALLLTLLIPLIGQADDGPSMDSLPAAALAEHEAHYDDGGIRPLERVPDAIRSQIQSNTGLMIGLGLQGTPALIFQDSQGRWRVAPGVVGEEALRVEVFQINE